MLTLQTEPEDPGRRFAPVSDSCWNLHFTSNGFWRARGPERSNGATLGCSPRANALWCQPPLSQLPDNIRCFSLLFLFPFRDLGGKLWYHSTPWRFATNPPFKFISVHIYAANVLILCHQRMFLTSILPVCANIKQQQKKKKPQSPIAISVFPRLPTFPGPSLESRVDWKLGQTEEESRTGTSWHPRHRTAFSMRRAVTHLRRLRTSMPVSCLKPSLFQCPFQHFPFPFWWF